MPLPAAAHVVAWVALGSGIAWVAASQGEVRRRLSAVERAPLAAAAASDAPAAAPAAADPEIAVLRGRLEAAERTNSDRVDEVKKEVQRLWAEWLRSPDGGAGTSVGEGDPKFEAAVRGVVERYAMERKFREAVQKAAGPLVPKKPSFEQLSKALELKPAQSQRLAQDVQAIQQELFELLGAPRADGVSLIEEIQQAEQYPEGNPKRAEVFLKLFKLTIPNTEETYVERAVSLVSRVKEDAKGYLEPSQLDLLSSIDLDWFGIRFP